ncbi:MAG: Rz-like lysis system protein LysB [Duganella sp.]
MKETALFLVLLAVGGMVWYVAELRSDLVTARSDLETASKTAATRADTIARLQRTQRNNDLARMRLDKEQAAIRLQLASREDVIRTLQNDNEEMRAWADRPLPAAVIGLRAHGAITGAAAYREHLSGDSAVPVAGGERPQ